MNQPMVSSFQLSEPADPTDLRPSMLLDLADDDRFL